MNILGINCFSHDTSACLVQDGKIVAFVEEERFNRDKHTKGFPRLAIEYCLNEGGITSKDLDYVGFAYRPGLDFVRAMRDIPRYLPGSYRRIFYQPALDLKLYWRRPAFRWRHGYWKPALFIGHHEAHAASSFFASPFEEAAILSIDRGGDYISTLLAHGRGTKITTIKEIRQPHSLGELYAAVTKHLGFKPNCDEGKVMGLAPYGRPTFEADFDKLVDVAPDGNFKVALDYFCYYEKSGWYTRKFLDKFGAERMADEPIDDRHEDVAWGVQSLTEKTALRLAEYLHQVTGSRNLCIAGGVGLNSVMNAVLLQKGPFEQVYVQPAANDAGNALGAALYIWHHLLGHPREQSMEHAYYGPRYGPDRIKAAAEERRLPWRQMTNAAAYAAEKLVEGKIVGWFQGRAEVGPRALGNRSILANACMPEMKDIVNLKIKKREPFRPFAPAILEEEAHNYIDDYHPSPFMLLVLDVKPDKRSVVPAITHVDGTARLQTVTRSANPRFWEIINEFGKRTGVPVLLNTSFNVQGEPIVLTPANAVNTFLASNMDCLVMEDFVIERPDA